MNSTDEKRLRAFFAANLAAAAIALRARGVGAFPTGPDHASATWYQPPPSPEPEFVEFDSLDDVERTLREIWTREQLPELLALLGPLMALARKLETRDAVDDDVDPFIYAMS